MRKILLLFLMCVTLQAAAQDMAHYKKIIKELSSAKYRGRGYAFDGANKAGKYLEFEKNQHYYKEPEIDCDVRFLETGDSSVEYPSMYFDTPDVIAVKEYK